MKVIILTKKSLLGGVLIAALAVAVLVAAFQVVPRVAAAMASHREVPIYSVERADKKISISFDAAWGNEDTQKLIDILGKYRVHATFFVVGAWVDKYPESVKALSDAGNEVMNHSNTHPHMTQLSRDGMLKEIEACDAKIQKATGKKPVLFRAPYGDYNNALIETLKASGHFCIQWDVDSLDWKGISASDIQKRVLSKVRPGSIVLFHNAALHTPEALPGIIESLQKDGYQIVPISQLIYRGDSTVDVAGRQRPAASSSAAGALSSSGAASSSAAT